MCRIKKIKRFHSLAIMRLNRSICTSNTPRKQDILLFRFAFNTIIKRRNRIVNWFGETGRQMRNYKCRERARYEIRFDGGACHLQNKNSPRHAHTSRRFKKLSRPTDRPIATYGRVNTHVTSARVFTCGRTYGLARFENANSSNSGIKTVCGQTQRGFLREW